MDLVTGPIGSLLSKLGKLLKEEYNLQTGLRAKVESLRRELEGMQAALRKLADVPCEQLDEQDRLWTRDVRELSYDIEDVVDTFLVRVDDGSEQATAVNWLTEQIENLSLKSKHTARRRRIAKAINNIDKQIKAVSHRRKRYKVYVEGSRTPIDPRLRALYAEATELVGIHGKRDQELIKMLTEGADVKPKTVSIVGFGGLGKTTLVRAVQNKIKGDFGCSAFVPVGRSPDVKKVLRDILHELDKQKYTKEVDLTVLDERQLIDEVREFLEKKRYLIIIDDVWDEEMWKFIRCAFSNENNLGSRLITTTRKVNVAKTCCSSSDDLVYKMEPLSNEDSQRLFYQRIFPNRNGCPPELEQVSRDILKKCGGVPLAIITIASLLASKKQIEDQWYVVLNSLGRGLIEDNSVGEMLRILSFSYYDLPSHLKTCLLYLSIFPEDYKINTDDVIWRWIAEGFVQCEKPQTSLFELGESYLNQLINRSMIQPEDDGSCRVHDMVLDLICSLSSDENFVTVLDGIERRTTNSQSVARRLSLQNTSSMVDQSISSDSISKVRSIIVFPPASNLTPSLSRFDVLRVLDLHGCDIEKSSHLKLKDVGNLFHLRYLGLANTGIRELPAEIGNLQFLLVLDVRDNNRLKKLPPAIVKLKRLMCLLFDEGLEGLPDGMGKLTSVEVLGWLSSEKSPNIVKELRNLTRLRELEIELHGGCLELEEAFVESLCNLCNIEGLSLRGPFESLNLLEERWVPPRHLRVFYSYYFEEFPTVPAWIKRNPLHLSNLIQLSIQVKELWQEDLQILGRLPALRFLEIKSIHKTRRLLLVGADGFQCVMSFELHCNSSGHIMFQQGALPKAETVEFDFSVQISKDKGNGDFDFGLGNLLSLRKVNVTIQRDEATFGEAMQAEGALRHAIHVHPNHPTILINFEPKL